MCPYQKTPPSKAVNGEITIKSLPMCEYTKKTCTFCVFGNCKTYNEAKGSEEKWRMK